MQVVQGAETNGIGEGLPMQRSVKESPLTRRRAPFRATALPWALAGCAAWALLARDACADDAAALRAQSAAALAEGDRDAALKLAEAAIAAAPEDAENYLARAAVHTAQDDYAAAVEDYALAIARAPQSAELYDLRGSAQFKAGQIDASIADFDRYLEFRPEYEPHHWKRGISYYYAGRYAEGRAQFEGYQTVDDSDVENAVWRMLCMARSDGFDAAQAAILRVGPDRRVPMAEIYALFAGRDRDGQRATPQTVLAAAAAGDPSPETLHERLFYAHLYLGLYCEIAGQPEESLEHLRQAVELRIGHYMWDVARVHLGLRTAKP